VKEFRQRTLLLYAAGSRPIRVSHCLSSGLANSSACRGALWRAGRAVVIQMCR